MRFLYILIFIQLSFSQTKGSSILIKQDFNIESTKVLNFENSFVFIDSVYAEKKMQKELYQLNDTINIENLLGVYSQSIKYNYKYYICDLYRYEIGFGLKKYDSYLTSSIEKFNTWNSNIFQKNNSIININTDFSCQTDEIIFENIIYLNEIQSFKVLFELDRDNLFFSIFNSNCVLIEKIKYDVNDFSYYCNHDYIVLKSKKYIILFTSK